MPMCDRVSKTKVQRAHSRQQMTNSDRQGYTVDVQ